MKGNSYLMKRFRVRTLGCKGVSQIKRELEACIENALKSHWFMLLGNKESQKILNAAQTCLNEKLLEVNICLCSVFSVMVSNYFPVGLLTMGKRCLHQSGKIGFPPRLTCCDGATLPYRTEAEVRLISCLFLRKHN